MFSLTSVNFYTFHNLVSNIFIHISIYIVIYKHTFYNIIMMRFRKKSNDLYESVPFKKKGTQFGVISSENKNMSYIQSNNISTLNVYIGKVLHAIL